MACKHLIHQSNPSWRLSRPLAGQSIP
jgi:hypothetical protein